MRWRDASRRTVMYSSSPRALDQNAEGRRLQREILALPLKLTGCLTYAAHPGDFRRRHGKADERKPATGNLVGSIRGEDRPAQ